MTQDGKDKTVSRQARYQERMRREAGGQVTFIYDKALIGAAAALDGMTQQRWLEELVTMKIESEHPGLVKVDLGGGKGFAYDPDIALCMVKASHPSGRHHLELKNGDNALAPQIFYAGSLDVTVLEDLERRIADVCPDFSVLGGWGV